MYITHQSSHGYGCKVLATKNRNICGPLMAKNAKYAENLWLQLLQYKRPNPCCIL